MLTKTSLNRSSIIELLTVKDYVIIFLQNFPAPTYAWFIFYSWMVTRLPEYSIMIGVYSEVGREKCAIYQRRCFWFVIGRIFDYNGAGLET